MKCPLKHTLELATDQKRAWRDDDCLGSECEWFVSEKTHCAMHALANTLEELGQLLAAIKATMPGRDQFTK